MTWENGSVLVNGMLLWKNKRKGKKKGVLSLKKGKGKGMGMCFVLTFVVIRNG